MSVRKAVFPVAGIGSRFLPATKANPKEMLPVVDKPLIQYAVDEAVRVGITHMIFITRASKRAIADHFNPDPQLEMRLEQQGKTKLLELVRNVAPSGIEFSYVQQDEPRGLGHAVLCAEEAVGDEPFVVLLADDLIDDSRLPCLAAMIEHFNEKPCSSMAVQPVPWHDVHQYGVVRLKDAVANYSRIESIVEKPHREFAPSNLAAVGRYLFTPAIFSCLKNTVADQRGEIQLTDAIARLLEQEPVYAWLFNGKRYDCGSKLGYLQATIAMGLEHPETAIALGNYIKELCYTLD